MLYQHTVQEALIAVLKELMKMPSLKDFRLVGGTALSLQLGHRLSEDIDLFTHLTYGSVDFEAIKEEISKKFNYVYDKRDIFPRLKELKENLGFSLQIGNSMDSAVKVDIFNWTEPFLDEAIEKESIRFASLRDIALMKLETISRNGRKKDFWDLSELLEIYTLSDLLKDYQKRYPYNSIDEVKAGLKNFYKADELPDPISFKSKSWEGVKMEIKRAVAHLSKQQRKGPRL